MQSAVEKLREYRGACYQSSDEIIKLWESVLSKCDLSTLGDEKWLIIEQVFKSSLLCSKSDIAQQCLDILNGHFQNTSPRCITLKSMYLDFIGEHEKAKEIIGTVIDDNEVNYVKKSINLIHYLVHICTKSYDISQTNLLRIEQYCEEINESIILDNRFNECAKALNKIKSLIESHSINDNLKKEINRVLDDIQSCLKMLSNEMKHMKHQIRILNNKYPELQQDILILKKQASKKVLDEVYAHLLIPFTKKYEDEFEKNRSNTNQTAFHSYKRNLRKILSGCSVSDSSLEILNKIINEFVDETNISKKDFINLLLNKIECNYHAYHIIDDYIEDLMSNQTTTDSIIEYLEDQYSMNLVIQTNDQINLQKLIKLNIKIKAEEKSLDAFLDRYFDIKQDPNHMTGGSFRMPIVEKYEENDTIITGKIESGRVCVGNRCVVLPNEVHVEVANIHSGDNQVNWCSYGRNVRITLKNVQEKDISVGFILCDASQYCRVGRVSDAQVELIEHKSSIRPGYSSELHIHTAVAVVRLEKVIALIDRTTGETIPGSPKFLRKNQIAIARFKISQDKRIICMELFEEFPRLGRFALFDGEQIVVVGKVLQISQ